MSEERHPLTDYFAKPLAKLTALGRRRWKLLLGALIVVGLIAFWRYRSQQRSQPQLVFQRPAIENLTKTLEVSGLVDAKEKASLRFIAGGKVVYIGAKEGEFVKKFQTIATIDRATLQKQLQQDLNDYLTERWDWEQTLDNSKDRTLPKSELRDKDQEQWALENTVLDVEIRDIAIRNTALYSPLDGLLTHAPAMVPGVQLLATDTFEIINPATLVFRAAVDEADISLVKNGQAAEISLDSFPDQVFSSQVRYIAYTSSQSTTGTVFVVEFPLTDPQLELFKIGMNGDVAITLDTREQVMTIPQIAIKQRNGATFVDVKTGKNTAAEREIVTGLETEEKIEVISGLSLSDEVVVPE
jgi:RND family efflux transporter MFP subunit